MKPVGIHKHNYVPVSSDPPKELKDWRSELCALKTEFKMEQITFALGALISKFGNAATAAPNEDELNTLVSECMYLEAAPALTAILAQHPLATLHISKQDLNLSGWDTLRGALPDSSKITKFLISKQEFDGFTMNAFGKCMEKMPDLQTLSFSKCKIGYLYEWPALLALQSLSVEQTRAADDMLLHILDTSPVTTFHLKECPDLDIHMHRNLAKALGRRTQLRELTLSKLELHGNKLGDVLETYATVLAQQNLLEHLDLSSNRLHSNHYQVLGEVLQDKSNLTSLSLAGCLKDLPLKFDAVPLAKLVKLSKLVKLDLSANTFSEDLAPVLMALVSHSTLQQLDLHQASLSEKLRDYLTIILTYDSTLISLRLMTMNDKLYAPLAQAMDRNSSLRHLSITELEEKRLHMPEEQFSKDYPNYLALMNRVQRNRSLFEASQQSNDETAIRSSLEEMLMQQEGFLTVSQQKRLQD
jgi:hypothetical protein